ncbi:hypothetical protein C0991_011639 [Blastosporella zonata]|nr:hypothetical protein C0991_011639 [Blastosporella zonata]
MSVGCITIESIAKFTSGAKRYFIYKAVAADAHISHVSFCFDNLHVAAWIDANNAVLMALTFDAFILQLRAKFLSASWFLEYGKCIASAQHDTPFADWSAAKRQANQVVASIPNLFMDDARLQLFMCILMHDDLLAEYNAKNTSAEAGQSGLLDNIVNLDDWCTAVGHINDDWRTRKDREHKSYLRQLKALGNLSSNTSVPSASTALNSRLQSSQPFQKQAQSYTLPLTVDKRNLLAANKGCTACCKVFLPTNHKCAYKEKPLPFGLVPTIT